MQGVGILEIFDMHRLFLHRTIKKALWTVLPSSSNMTLKNLLPAFVIRFQRRILLSDCISSLSGCMITLSIHSNLMFLRSIRLRVYSKCCVNFIVSKTTPFYFKTIKLKLTDSHFFDGGRLIFCFSVSSVALHQQAHCIDHTKHDIQINRIHIRRH